MSNVTPINTLNQIVAGQVVMLRSGGPAMTVRQVHADLLICAWFNADGDMSEARFFIREVELVK